MRYLKSFLVGLGMYLLAIAAWDFGWMFITPTDLQIYDVHRVNDFYVMLPAIIGHIIGVAAFAAGFYWMFRRTSARSST
jgi:hypothetical protein